jgi:hypothetical protein
MEQETAVPEHKRTEPRKFKATEPKRASSVLKTSKPKAPGGKKSVSTGPGPTEMRNAAPAPAPGQVPPFAGFNRERETYARLKADLMERAEGLYVVIQGEDLEGPVETYGDALRAGYRRFGLDQPFLVQQILAVEPVAAVSRDVVPCPA